MIAIACILMVAASIDVFATIATAYIERETLIKRLKESKTDTKLRVKLADFILTLILNILAMVFFLWYFIA